MLPASHRLSSLIAVITATFLRVRWPSGEENPNGLENGNGLRAAWLPCPPGFRTNRTLAAGRRCARRLSGRRLSGALRSEPPSALGRRNLHRRHQFGPDRRQPAGTPGRTPPAILGDRHRTAVRLCRCPVQGRHPEQPGAPVHQSGRRLERPAVGSAELLQAAHSAADLHAGQQSRELELLRRLAAQDAARPAGRLRPARIRARCG